MNTTHSFTDFLQKKPTHIIWKEMIVQTYFHPYFCITAFVKNNPNYTFFLNIQNKHAYISRLSMNCCIY